MPGILIVDDDPFILSFLGTVLRHAGIEVWLARSGEEALEQYRQGQNRIHLVLLDVILPGMSGPRIHTSLQGICPTVRVCFMSGNPWPFEPGDLLARGALHFLHKPFSLEDLSPLLSLLTADGQYPPS